MIQTSIKLTPGIRGFGVNSASLFRQTQMAKLGQFALATVRARAQRGVGSDDVPMPPLTSKTSPIMHDGKFVRQRVSYAQWKSQHGLRPTRDLVGAGKDGGHLWDGVSVRLATEDMVRIAFTAQRARAKALANERRAPFFSFSPSDVAIIAEYAARLFHASVQGIRLLK